MNSNISANGNHLLLLTGKDLIDAVRAEVNTNPAVYLADLFALMDQRVDGSFLRLKRSEWTEVHEDGIRTAASDPSSPFWPNRYGAVDLRLAPAALKLARAIRAEHKRYAATAPRSVPKREKMLADYTVPLRVITPKEVADPNKVRLTTKWAFDEEISDAEFRLAVTLLLGFHNTRTGVCNPSTRTGLPLSGGPVSVLVHDGPWRYGWGGRGSCAG